jgi:alpha-beta hydrolase superfamily lysophospholipase
MRDLIQFQEPRVESGIRTPTLVFHGTDDRAVSIHYARRFAEPDRNPGATLVELPGTGHQFLKYKRSLLGDPVVDRRATERMTREMAATVSSFISDHVGGIQ